MRGMRGGTSRNVEDRRGSCGIGMGTMGIGGTVVLLILSLVFGRDFISGSGGDTSPQASSGEVAPPTSQTPEEMTEGKFVSWVLDTTQATWARLTPQQLGAKWHDAKLLLLRGATKTRCVTGQAA